MIGWYWLATTDRPSPHHENTGSRSLAAGGAVSAASDPPPSTSAAGADEPVSSLSPPPVSRIDSTTASTITTARVTAPVISSGRLSRGVPFFEVFSGSWSNRGASGPESTSGASDFGSGVHGPGGGEVGGG